MPRSPNLAQAAAVFLAVFALFVAYSRTLPSGADDMLYFGLTQSICNRRSR